jgi:hypothetical protein
VCNAHHQLRHSKWEISAAYSGKVQTPPGNEEEMNPKVDHGESSYEGLLYSDVQKSALLAETLTRSDFQQPTSAKYYQRGSSI